MRVSSDRAIRTAVEQMSGTFGKDSVSLLVCKVKSVDEDKSTCIVVTKSGKESVEIPNVSLQVGVCDGLQIIPKVDSDVLILRSTYQSPFVVNWSDVDKYYIQVGDSSFTIENDGTMQLNDGAYDGLVKVKDLTDKINALENLVNNLLNTLKSTTIPLAPSGTYPFAPLYAAFNPIQPITQQSDIENKNITHG
jgi:hypothetical protein